MIPTFFPYSERTTLASKTPRARASAWCTTSTASPSPSPSVSRTFSPNDLTDNLRLTLQEANKLETLTTSRLKQSGKLSLIVDLDQTIIHATVDPTVGEWLADPTNPNFGALDGTSKFRLGGEGAAGDEGCWYFVKMRCGALPFRV